MRDDILDEIEETIEIGDIPIYANKSFNQFLFSILIYTFIFFNQLPLEVFHYGAMKISNLIIGLGFGLTVFLLNLFGMINASKSERFQELTSWKKYVGAVGNMLLFFPSVLFFVEFLFAIVSYFGSLTNPVF